MKGTHEYDYGQANENPSHIIDIRLPNELDAGQQNFSRGEFVRRQQGPEGKLT
jgi:hypothetical protein